MPDPNQLSGFRSGDISESSPTTGKDQDLAKHFILYTARVQPNVGEALGATCAYVAWLLGHMADLDRAAGLEGFISALRTATLGVTSVPLSRISQIKFQDPTGKDLGGI